MNFLTHVQVCSDITCRHSCIDSGFLIIRWTHSKLVMSQDLLGFFTIRFLFLVKQLYDIKALFLRAFKALVLKSSL